MGIGDKTVESLINKDTDGDGIPDWEENLLGTNPNKKDTNDDGILDNIEIEKRAIAEGSSETQEGNLEENLTETDKFSRELFSTIATLSQTGQVDQTTVNKISASLIDQIKNSPPRIVFSTSDIKIIADNSISSIKQYNIAVNSIYNKYPINNSVIDILEEFSSNAENPDSSVLSQLDPIIKQIDNIINAMLKTNVPQELSLLHLDVINGLERVMENLNDIELFDTDAVVAMSAMSKYQENADNLQFVSSKMGETIKQKIE